MNALASNPGVFDVPPIDLSLPVVIGTALGVAIGVWFVIFDVKVAKRHCRKIAAEAIAGSVFGGLLTGAAFATAIGAAVYGTHQAETATVWAAEVSEWLSEGYGIDADSDDVTALKNGQLVMLERDGAITPVTITPLRSGDLAVIADGRLLEQPGTVIGPAPRMTSAGR